MSPLETELDIGIVLRSKVDESGNVYSLYPITRDIDVALTTECENGELTLDDKLKTYDSKHQECAESIEKLQKSTWSGTKEELMTAIENGEIGDGTTVYITDDYSEDGQDLSIFATIDYVDTTFVPLEEGKGLSSTDVTSDDVERWNTSSDITARLDGDATVDGSVAQKIAEVVSGAPEKYDTLVEIANWIESDTDGAAAMDLKISENAKNIELKLDKDGGDTMDNITTFTSNDTTESTSWTDVDVMVSGEKHNGLFSKISTMFKNIRYLYKLLGTTSISSIGDGTVSGAISTLNSNMVSYKKYTIAAGETKRVLVREVEGIGNLVLFSTYMVIPSYKTIFFASSGNGNNTNIGQNITITTLLESSVITVTPVNESGKYNCLDITNNGSYSVTLHANTLYGTPPVFY